MTHHKYAADDDPEQAGPQTGQEPTRVYLVDDDPAVCDSVQWLLESIDIEPTVCFSADEFLELYQGQHPACIVLDVRMPRMSGTKLQHELNRIAPHVAIIFVSAHGDIQMSVSALRAGAENFLEKPYSPQQLLDAVQAGIITAQERFINAAERRQVSERIATLTTREREILTLVIEGLPSQNIARRLGLSVKTVDVHRARIKSKTDAESISTLVRDILRADVEHEVRPDRARTRP